MAAWKDTSQQWEKTGQLSVPRGQASVRVKSVSGFYSVLVMHPGRLGPATGKETELQCGSLTRPLQQY